MKLSEIRAAFDAIEKEIKTWPTPTNGDEIGEQWQRHFELLPRVKYADLPASLKKQVRDETITTKKLKAFLNECYSLPDFLPDDIKQHEKQNPNYKSFDDRTKEIDDTALEHILIKTRNNAIYTIERNNGKFRAVLYGNHAEDAFETVLDEYRRRSGQSTPARKEKRKSDRLKDYALGGTRQMIPSDQRYSHALTFQRNEHAYIALMPSGEEFIKQFSFSDGKLIYNDNIAAIIRKESKGKYEDIQQLDLPLLAQIYTAAIKTAIRHEGHSITVSIPQFFKEMGIDTQSGNAIDALSKIQQFEKCWAIMPQRGFIYQLIHISGFDTTKQEMDIDVPYFYKLREVLIEENTERHKLKSGNSYEYIKPHHNMLVHSTIVSERNKTAVEVVYYITNALLQRGFVADDKTYKRKDKINNASDNAITFNVSYRKIINECFFFRARLQSSPNKNVVLKRTFEKAFQLLTSQTDIKQYFVDLEATRWIVPTMKTLDDDFIIKHHGENVDYKPDK